MPKRFVRVPLTLIERLTLLSYTSLLFLWTTTVLGFAIVYYTLSFLPGQNGLSGLAGMEPLYRFLDSLYFSVVTSTTVGYGDLIPHGVSKLFAAIQSVSGFFIAALFVAKLVAYRQEVTLERVYELNFQDHFRNTREGFYLVRKDLDQAIHEVRDTEQLSGHGWENLHTAFHQTQSLLEEVLAFYSGELHAYTIDEKREVLLLDAVERTVARLQRLLQAFEKHTVDWRADKGHAREIRDLLSTLQETVAAWHDLSPRQDTPSFRHLEASLAELLALGKTVKTMTKKKRLTLSP